MSVPSRRAKNELGAYLRRRREAVDPESLRLPRGRRRVQGLRREEVATFSGVSVDYYTRLEQGREDNPSTQLLSALGRVLALTEDERLHLHRLAGAGPVEAVRASSTEVPREVRGLLDRWTMNPAFVYNDAQDVLATNPLGEVLHRGFSRTDNFARMMFLDPAAKEFYRDWDVLALDTVGALRQAWGKGSVRAAVQLVVDDLVAGDVNFARWWEEQSVVGKTHNRKRLHHPDVGDLTLEYHHFVVPSSHDLHLLVCDAEPGGDAEESLRFLGTAAGDHDVTRATIS